MTLFSGYLGEFLDPNLQLITPAKIAIKNAFLGNTLLLEFL